MTRNKILLIFRLVISAIGVSEGRIHQETIIEYIKEITATNQQKSIILVYNEPSAFEDFSTILYGLHLPSFNIYLRDLKKFNGKYNDGYDIKMTYEESKLFFVFMKNLGDIYAELSLMRKIYFWRDRDRVVVFVNGNYSLPALKASFLFCYQFYVVNIVFAFVGDKIEAFSYNPFSKDYSLRTEHPRNFFPDNFQTLYGYRLRVSMFPSVINHLEENEFHGADGHMARIIASQLNATYTYIPTRPSDRAPVLTQYDDVAERIADVGLTTRYVKLNFENLIEKTYPHDRDDLTCLIPKIHVKKFTGMHSLLPDSVWFLSLATSLLFFLYVLAELLLNGRKLDVVNVALTILLLLVNKPVTETRYLNFRAALIFYLTFCVFLNTLIVCRLTSIFTAPAHFQGIETVTELAETDYEILTIDRFEDLLNASLGPNLRDKILPRLNLIKEPEYLERIRKCRNVVFILKDHLANYAQIQKENYPNGVQFYRVMRERILPALSCYIVSYGSPFLKRVDELVRRIMEAGIYDYWKMKTWQRLGVGNEFRFNKNSYGNEVAVSLDDVATGVQILVFGLGTSFLVFLLEMLAIKLFKSFD